MTTIDSCAAMKVQPEMWSGESVHWAGMPNPKIIFHSDDWAAIPSTLIWTGFFVFWEGNALGYWGRASRPSRNDLFNTLWGIPFLIVGNYMVWGRFLHDAWLKRRTYYAVTNRRVLILQESWKRRTNWTYLEAIPAIEREGDATGTLWFGKKYPVIAGRRQKTRSMSRFEVSGIPVFADIDEVDGVQRLVQELRENVRKDLGSGNMHVPGPLTYPHED